MTAARLLPNLVTVMALCAGLSSIRFALMGDAGAAVAAIGVAALLDGIDGRLARLLDATSALGAELDSLADAVSFGVAPALVLYQLSLTEHRIGWPVAMAFAVCVVLRLARFNVDAVDPALPGFAAEFFVGVPAPVSALLVLMPLIVTQEHGTGWWGDPWVVTLWTIAMGLLAVSRIPTLSAKTFTVSSRTAPAVSMVGLAVLLGVVFFPWVVLSLGLFGYLAHLPVAARRHRWLLAHPEAWDAGPRQRRAIRREHRAGREIGWRGRWRSGTTGLRVRLRRSGAGTRPSLTADRPRRRRDTPGNTDQLPIRPR
jgi:CDP-diacylglycerol--serine O-phosphatidyltransferase